jgi:BON domain
MGIYNRTKRTLWGAAFGAGLMYLFDPARGRRRRKVLADRVRALVVDTEEDVERSARDLAHRAHGVVAEARAAFEPDAADDDVIRERVRARLGRLTTHAAAIETTVQDGCVTLSGPVLSTEVEAIVTRVRRVRGVRAVENQLEVHDHADVPPLQGGSRPPRQRRVLAPAARVPLELIAPFVGARLLSRLFR